MATPLNLLVVEDSPDDTDLLVRQLRRAGFDPHWKRVELEADFLAEIRKLPDIILSDYSMPRFNGLRAAQLLRQSGLNIPLILVSGTLGEEAAVEAMKEGAADYVLKDRMARLGNAVQRVLEEKQLRQKRRQAEEALRASEEKFRQLAENINEVSWITSADLSELLYLSPSYEKVWGRAGRSLCQNSVAFLQAVLPEDRGSVLAALEELKRGEKIDLEFRLVRPDGQIRWVHSSGTAIRNESGVIYRLAGIAEDITQRMQTELQFRQAQKMEGIGQLAGGVAHDFNNILLIMRVNLELVLTTDGTLGPTTRNRLTEIAQAAERAATLNRQLLTFSRSEAMQMRFLDLNDLTAGFTKMLRRIVGEHIRVQNDFAPTLPAIKADPGMIEQVLMNLAVNARDAMPNGGQLIIGTELAGIDPARAKLDPRTRAGHFACLSVRDTGTGIAPEIMPRIFEPFFTTKGVGQGTGLGLATVFGIAQQHNGWVDVSSQVGVGTTFRVFLPLSSEEMAASGQTVAQDVRGGTEKVLLVEDDRGVRDAVLQILENYGYAVVEADSGIAAQKVWAEQGGQFDLLITNMVMPGGLTGLQLSERLRVQKPGLKVLLMTGYRTELARGATAGANGITLLHKPFSTRVFAETIRKCLDAA